MDGIKAHVQGEGIDSSVEFSVEEVIAQHRGKRWRDLNEEEREAALKDYALGLFTRQGGAGTAEDLSVSIEEGSFSRGRGLPRDQGRASAGR